MSETKMITLTIDGRQTEVPEGSTILEAARTLDIAIPTLCQDDRLQPFGACRMCVVAVKAMRGRLTTACSTPVTQGMEVATTNEMIERVRKMVLELLQTHHPLDCPVCDKAGECKLQDYAYDYGMAENRIAGFQEKFEKPPEIRSPLVERIPNRCILCGLCVRVCDEVQCVGEISFVHRGFVCGIGTLFDRPLECQFCGQCIDICPVGALIAKPFKHKVRVWELEQTPSICNWCGVGCRVIVEQKRGKVYRVRAEKGQGVNYGNLCGKGRYGFGYLHADGRLDRPYVRKEGELAPASWEEALDRAAELIARARDQAGGKAVGLIAGPRATNESLWLARELFGKHLQTPNVGGQQEDLAVPLLSGIKSVFGAAANAVFDDVFAADAMLVVANDGVDAAPVLGNRTISRSRFENVTLTVIDANFTAQMKQAQTQLQCQPGTENDVLAAFLATVIDEHLGGGRPDVMPLRAALGDPAKLCARTGLALAQIQEAARRFAKGQNKLILVGAHPYDRSGSYRLGVMAADLAVLTGAKLLPVLEKSNLRGTFELNMTPGEDGLGYDAMLLAAGEAVKAVLVMGDDPYTHAPGGKAPREGLEKLEGLIVADLYFSETAKRAEVVFPAAAFAEQDGTITNSEGRVQALRRAIPAPGEARPDWQIVMELGRRLGWEGEYADAAALHKEMATQEAWVGEELPAGGEAVEMPEAVKTDGLVAPPEAEERSPSEEYPFGLLTGPLLWHSGTTSTRSAHLADVHQGPKVRIHSDDAEKAGIADGDRVRLVGPEWSVEAIAEVGEFAAPGSVFLPNHYADAPAAGFFRQGRAEVRIEKLQS